MGNVISHFSERKKEFLNLHQKARENKTLTIQVGAATCENAAGAEAVKAELEKLVLASGRRDIRIQQTGCTGRCSREPIVGIFAPGQFPYKYEQVTVEKAQQIFQQHVLNNTPIPGFLLDKKTSNLYSRVVTFCSVSTVSTGLSGKWAETFQNQLKTKNVAEGTVRVFTGGCLGLMPKGEENGRIGMLVFPERTIYIVNSETELAEILESHILGNRVVSKFLAKTDPLIQNFFELYGDVAFFNKQTRLTLRNSGIIDPEDLNDYVAHNGFEALSKVLNQNQPKQVIEEVTRSGLRGRGGAGFPTGKKWLSATESPDPVRFVICNADEGDPGAYMDRSALEGDPFSIVEGMTIGAFAIQAQKGFLYIRAEYPLAIRRMENAIEKCRAAGLLGKNILNSGFDFDLEIRLGAGAFVCGEETALMYSIAGRRGQPRIRPPYPTQSGLWGHPTVINNVETWANIPVILMYGADWFSRMGTEKSKGTKVFALAGKIKNSGLVEVPMGTTLREVIFEIGGGMPAGRTFKAAQTGGPSGGCLPTSTLDTPVDYESLAKAGSIMGSGGLIVLDDQDCMVATSKYFLEFTQEESCGKCVPCREGTLRMLEILERITSGQGVMEDLDKLERLAVLIQKSSLCGLGQNAPNPVLSNLKNFRSEFIEHIRDKRCATHKCSKLIRYEINPEKCTGCTLCARRCPVSCISGSPRKVHTIDQERCIKCGECFNACKFSAVQKL